MDSATKNYTTEITLPVGFSVRSESYKSLENRDSKVFKIAENVVKVKIKMIRLI